MSDSPRIRIFLSTRQSTLLKERCGRLGYNMSEFFRIMLRRELAEPRIPSRRELFGPRNVSDRSPRATERKKPRPSP